MFELLSSLRYRLFSQARPALENMKLRYDDSNENPLMIQFFTWDCLKEDISWWKHFENEIPALAAMGITQVWLPPPNKAAHKTGHGYDAYDLWDLGEFEQKGQVSTRWGTKDELLQACSVAQSHSIGILIDAVLNHKMGADRMEVMPAVPVRDDNRLKAIGKVRDIEGWTAYDFVGRQNKYSHFRWTQEHFTGVDWDQRSKTRQIFRISGGGHKGWSENVDRELGNYDYLLGADVSNSTPRTISFAEPVSRLIIATRPLKKICYNGVNGYYKSVLFVLTHPETYLTDPCAIGLFRQRGRWVFD
ncbi:hypothetical protein VNI00_005086 [Paramarasmius palmivorus]|uniref:Glycosyl hydrolase family 13 catalytic domain-containing protein n=1 Tax=Paramarasmius palmivorus TaxID=297713 RepID=A0AAW0DJR6_9AGAR